jgi:hypothetical protein
MNNPTGNKVELGIQQSGINGDNASGVTVRSLVFEKFANPPQFAALGHQFPLANWTIENNETSLNHYEGSIMREPWRRGGIRVSGHQMLP